MGKLPIPSIEQEHIINASKEGKNIICNAVAGSGKTTTICMIGKANPKKNILLLTYNKRLRHETKIKIKKNFIKNVQVNNFHSFCYNKYFVSGNTDQMIYDAFFDWEESHETKFNYHTIVIDEAQDLSPLYVRLVKMIIQHNEYYPQLIIIGDTRQTIYGFNGADSRFLTMADKIFNCNTFEWVKLQLTTSYRLSNCLTDFLNKSVLKENIIQSNGEKGIKPRYIFCNAFDILPVQELICHYLVKFNYAYSDIFILAPSIQSDLSPIKMLANTLCANHNIPIFIPTSDSEKLDTQISVNKIIFASFHQVKGLERKCVIVMGFDNSYYYYYNPDGSKATCPNELYVGLTRCSERLTIIHHYKKNFLNFLNQEEIPKTCFINKIKSTNLEIDYFDRHSINTDIRIFDNIVINDILTKPINVIMDLNNYNNSLNKDVRLTVTKLISYLPHNIVKEALKLINVHQIRNVTKRTGISSKVFDQDEEEDRTRFPVLTEEIKNDKFVVSYFPGKMIIENVSEIIGTSIPVYYEYIKYNSLPIIGIIEQNLLSKPKGELSVYRFIESRFKTLKRQTEYSPSNIFELVAIHNGLTNNVIHKVNQIKNFKLMGKQDLDKCMRRLNNHIVQNKSKPIFEQYYETLISMDLGYDEPVKRILCGFVDCMDDKNLWEFKTVRCINDTHILQLAIYAYLYYANMETGKEFKLLNINDGLKISVSGSPKQFSDLVMFLYKYKFSKPIILTDEEFILQYTN